jgi:translocation and assembly module TamB
MAWTWKQWHRKLGWIAIGFAGLVAILVIAGFVVLRTQRFHEFVLAQLQQQASEATGGQVRIQNFSLHLSNLTANAYGITIRGSEPVSRPPLVLADELMVRLKIISLLRKKVDLNEIILRHPVVNLLVKKDGTTNLPSAPKSNSNSSTSPFDLGIQHVVLSNGEIYYNDIKIPLEAELHDMQLELKSELLSKGYDGTLSYRDGRLQYGDMKPLPHDLKASFNASPAEFILKPLVLTVASSTIELEGNVQNYSSPTADGSYKITIQSADFRPVLGNPSLPIGEVTLAGALRYRYQADVPALRSVVLDGQLNGRELAIHSADLRTVIRNVRGEFKLANGNLEAHGLGADLLGGHLTASATMQHLDTSPVASLHASLLAISLSAAKTALRTANLEQIPIDGHIDGNIDAGWIGSAQNLKAQSDIGLKATLASAAAGSARVPLDGTFHLNYDNRSGLATSTNSFVRTPQTRVDINGSAGKKLALTVRARAADLRELDSLAAALRNSGTQVSPNSNPPNSMNLAGAVDAEVVIEGSTNDPHLRGQLSARNLELENTQWRSLQLGLQASKSGVAINNGSLVNAREGYVNFAFSSTLSDWHYLPSSPINVRLTSHGLAINQLLQIAKLDYPVTGTLSADLSIRGSQLNPTGSGSVRLVQAKVYGQPLQQLSLQFQGNGTEVNSSLEVTAPAGSVKANLLFNPKSKGYEVRLDAPGIKLAQLQPVQERNLGIAGVLTATVSGRGTLDDPQLTGTVQIPQLQIRQASISGIKADLNVGNHKAQLALDSVVAQTFVQAHGTMDLSDGYYTRATLDTKGMPIEGLLALYAPAKTDGPHGILEVHASAEGPLNDKTRMQAQVVIPTLKADYQGLQIGNTRPIRIRYANSIIALDPTEIAGTDTTLRLEGQLPLEGSAPVTLSAVGSVDMQLLRFFAPDIQSSGQLLLDVRGTGATSHPELQGQLRLQNVSVTPADAPLGLRNLNGILDIGNEQVNIAQLTGEAGGGQVSARGVIRYRPQFEMNVALQAKSVRIRYQDAIRTVLESDLNLTGTTEASTLSGRVLIDSLSFTQNFDLASLAGQVQSGPESTPSQGMAQNLKLNITVQTARDLNLTSSAVSLQGQANLRVIGTAADPVIVGRTEFTGGDIFLMNKRYQIERGVIEFSNPNRTEPVLNVLLTTTINQYNLSLTFLGPLDKMQTSYVSDPPLPTADIVNLIARGQTTQQAAAAPSNFGASSLLAQGAASQVSGGVQKLAGLSSLSIDPTLGGNDSNPGARVAMQKRVTSNFLFTFATDVTSAQREIIQGEYQFNKRWSASVTRDENGGFAVDGKYHKRF